MAAKTEAAAALERERRTSSWASVRGMSWPACSRTVPTSASAWSMKLHRTQAPTVATYAPKAASAPTSQAHTEIPRVPSHSGARGRRMRLRAKAAASSHSAPHTARTTTPTKMTL